MRASERMSEGKNEKKNETKQKKSTAMRVHRPIKINIINNVYVRILYVYGMLF